MKWMSVDEPPPLVADAIYEHWTNPVMFHLFLQRLATSDEQVIEVMLSKKMVRHVIRRLFLIILFRYLVRLCHAWIR